MNGYRIELGDLEANLRALDAITDAVVLPVQKSGRTDLAAFVVLAGEREGTDFEIASRLKTDLATRLPIYMLPRKFLLSGGFPDDAERES